MQFSRSSIPADEVIVSTRSSPPLPLTTLPIDPHIETDRRVTGRERTVAIGSALKGGAIAAVFCLFPAGFAVAMPLAGFLAVLFYRRQSWRADSSRRSGFKLGLLAGLFAFMIFGFFLSVQVSIPGTREELRKAMVDRLHTLEANYSDPEQRQSIEYFMTPKGFPAFVLLMTVFLGILFVFFAGIGGAVAAALLRRRGPPG